MSNRSVTVNGNVTGVINTGDNNDIKNVQNLNPVQDYLKKTLEELSVQFPDANNDFKIECVKQRITTDIKNNKPVSLALKDALLNGSQELVGILTDNPFVRLSMALLRGWIQ